MVELVEVVAGLGLWVLWAAGSAGGGLVRDARAGFARRVAPEARSVVSGVAVRVRREAAGALAGAGTRW